MKLVLYCHSCCLSKLFIVVNVNVNVVDVVGAVAGVPRAQSDAAFAGGRLLLHQLRASRRTEQETGPGRQIARHVRRQVQHRKHATNIHNSRIM